MELQRCIPIGNRNERHGRLLMIIPKETDGLMFLIDQDSRLGRTRNIVPSRGGNVGDQVSSAGNLDDLSLNSSRHLCGSWDVALAANSTCVCVVSRHEHFIQTCQLRGLARCNLPKSPSHKIHNINKR